MRKSVVTIGCLALAVTLAGCATTDMSGTPLGIGKTITFTTKETAPPEFDSWTFFWRFPAVERFDADLQYVVLLPDGGDPYVHDCGVVPAGGGVRSDFWPTMFTDFGKPDRDLITPFHGKNITIVVRATKGRIRFAQPDGFSFAFYRTGADGKVDRNNPIKQIDAVVRSGRTSR